MSKNNVNIVVFDEESVISDQSRVNYSTNRRPSAYDPYSSNNQQSILSSQLTQLTQKINLLQDKAEKITELVKNLPSLSLSEINTSVNNQSVNNGQIEQLLKVVQLKIQVVVQETKKIIEKMNGEFQKKLSKSMAQKNHETNSIAKIQAHCRETIMKVEQNYQDQVNIIRNEQINLQRKLMQKVEQMESDYKRKLKDFQNKEQQYIATIQHLENKLRMANKSKKLIEVTQERPTSSIKTEPLENISQMSSQQIGSSNVLPPNDTSKRRTRIFDSKGSNNSISPNNQVLSPLKTQNNIKNQTQSVVNKNVNPEGSKNYRMASTGQPHALSNNFITEAKQAYTQVKATVIMPPQQQNIPAVPKLQKEPDRSHRSEQQNLREKTQKEFYKDVPKPQWERFQDFNEHESSGSEEDVFFYPEHTKQEPKSVFDNSNNNSMHSPFDLN